MGALIKDLMQPILIVAPEGREEETIKRLARVGYDNAIGYLEGGFQAWKDAGAEYDQIETIDLKALAKAFDQDTEINIMDVRKPSEWSAEHIDGSINIPLDFINDKMSEMSKEKTYYMHCRSGYRSTVAASILKARGFEQLINVHGAVAHMEAAGLPMTDFVCPSTGAA